jgi:hypothetical protein|tara:strand:+ start:758 stop:1405 length:648 start_codon:yes stop_codon:yes gene_type:complete
MNFREKVIYDIQECIFKNNVTCNGDNSILLSHILDDYFCIVTNNHPYAGSFFCESCPNKMNPFFRQMLKLLLSKSNDGSGCFDHQSYHSKLTQNEVLDKMNNYFNLSNNFILVKYANRKIKPLSLFSYNDMNNSIWNVCTGLKYRNNGYMTTLFKHFLKMYKDGELNFMPFNKEEGLTLTLLKINPDFKIVKKYYNEHGFKIKDKLTDRIIMVLK